MAKAKLITVDRPTSVSRESVKEVIIKNAQTGMFADKKQPKGSVGQTDKNKK